MYCFQCNASRLIKRHPRKFLDSSFSRFTWSQVFLNADTRYPSLFPVLVHCFSHSFIHFYPFVYIDARELFTQEKPSSPAWIHGHPESLLRKAVD